MSMKARLASRRCSYFVKHDRAAALKAIQKQSAQRSEFCPEVGF